MSSSTNAQPPSAYLIYGLAIALAALFVDQAHKWAMIKGLALPEGQRFQLAPFLDIIYVRNTGISYGWLSQSSQAGQWALAGFAAAASSLAWSACYGKASSGHGCRAGSFMTPARTSARLR